MIDRKPAFAFAANRPNDLVVVTRLQSSVPPVAKRIQLFYMQGGRSGSFDFDLNDPVHMQSYKRLGKAAVKRILAEIKARSREKLEFSVWYFDDNSRKAIESLARDLSEEDATQIRAFETLVEISRLVNANQEGTEEPSRED